MTHHRQSEPNYYRAILGDASWARLHPSIQKRFSNPAHSQKKTYTGIMKEVYLSTSGKILAQLCRLIGTPLALHNGTNVPTEVHVYPNTKIGGMTWDRHYQYLNKPKNNVKSTKRFVSESQLMEVVGCGFGMNLKLYEKNSALYFESTQFFFQLGTFRIAIPDLLSPGKTIVSQRAIDNERFEFCLTVKHKILGNVFRQHGVFK